MKITIPVEKPDVTGEAGGLNDCPYLVVLDVDCMRWEALSNPLTGTVSGRVISLVQCMVEANVQFLLTDCVDPVIRNQLECVGIQMFRCNRAEQMEVLTHFQHDCQVRQEAVLNDEVFDDLYSVMTMRRP